MLRAWLRMGPRLLLLAAACAPRPAKETIPDQLQSAWEAAFNGGNLGALKGMYTQDCTLLAPNRDALRGNEAATEFLRENITQGLKIRLTKEDSEAYGDLGYRMGTYRIAGHDGRELDHGK